MNCIPGALILAVTMSGLETSAGLTEVWYREVFLGEVGSAASTYERVYTQRQPWQGNTDGERRIAALRAGMCFEMIGQVRDARLAYDWVLQHGRHGSAIVNVARARLGKIARARNLSSPDQPDGAARQGEVSLVRDRLADHLKDAREKVERGKVDLKSLRDKLTGLSLRVDAARRLRDRLQKRGAAVFVGSESTFATPARSMGELDNRLLETELRAELTEGFGFEDLLPGVADTFYLSALRVAAVRDVATAKRHLEQALALSRHHAAAQDFVEKLDSWQDSLADLARRYQLEERLRQIGELQGQVRDRLGRARGAQARRDSGVTLVVRIWELIGEALPEVRREAEISYLLREADRLFLALTMGVSRDAGPPGEELRKYLKEREVQIDDARSLVRKIVELTTELVAVGVTTGDEERAGTITIIEDELQRLLADGRSLLDAGSLDGCADSVREAELLLSWFQKLEDYRAPTRRLGQALVLKREIPSLQKELDGQQ